MLQKWVEKFIMSIKVYFFSDNFYFKYLTKENYLAFYIWELKFE